MTALRFCPLRCTLAAAVCAPAAALAHAGHGDIAGLGDGILHVVSGPDHLLAAVAAGVWAMAYAWKRAWLLPAAFVVAMLAGALIGIGHARMPAIEVVIAASLIVLGLLIARASTFSLAAATLVCAVVGAFHGFAHGTEAGSSGDYARYVEGLVIATVLLHACGMGIGLMLRIASRYGMRIGGALIAAAGVWFAVGLA